MGRLRALFVVGGAYLAATYLAYSTFGDSVGGAVKWVGAAALFTWSVWDSASAEAARVRKNVWVIFTKRLAALAIAAFVLVAVIILLGFGAVALSP